MFEFQCNKLSRLSGYIQHLSTCTSKMWTASLFAVVMLSALTVAKAEDDQDFALVRNQLP